MKKRETRKWTLWVHKQTGMYFDPCLTPRLGGQPTFKCDFEWVEVKEVVKRRKVNRHAERASVKEE